MKLNTLKTIPAIIWLIISYILLTIPGSDLPSADIFDEIYFDKWVHIGMFGLLTILWCNAVVTGQKPYLKVFIVITCLVIAYGVAMEYVQRYFTLDRDFDIIDIIADSVGSVAGLLFIIMLKRRIERTKNKPL